MYLGMPRRSLLKRALTILTVCGMTWRDRAFAAPTQIKVPEDLPAERFDLETKGIEGWTRVDGQWAVEEMAGAPSGKKVLVQRATRNEFNVIVAPPGPFSDVDVSVKFKPISGREDASGGIVFRFNDGRFELGKKRRFAIAEFRGREGTSNRLAIARIYHGRLAGGTTPFILRYSTSCP